MQTAEFAYLTYGQLRASFQRAREATHDLVQEVLFSPGVRQKADPVRGHYAEVIRFLNLAYYRFAQLEGAVDLARDLAREFEKNKRPFAAWALRDHVDLYAEIVTRVADRYRPPAPPGEPAPKKGEAPSRAWTAHQEEVRRYDAKLDRVGRLARGLSKRRSKALLAILHRFCEYLDWLDEAAARRDAAGDYADSDPAMATMPEAPSPLEVFGTLSYEPLIREVVVGGKDPREAEWLLSRLTYGLSLVSGPPPAPSA